MRNNSKRNWNNPHLEFYTLSLQRQLEHYFEQFNVPQELLVKEKLSKLLESTELYIEITKQGFFIQALNCGKSLNDQEEIGTGTEKQFASYSCPMEEKAHADPEIPTKSFATHAYMPHEIFLQCWLWPNQEAAKKPTKLPEFIITDVLQGVVHNKSESGNSHDIAHT
ncbi:hypothetical protein D8674_029060 [Pyrus ussuriensis x Pyrus communis]|uniref:Uncharacterized protein n=1 Tax=Pyrus ussuriensis x Pyrus communis TaxID=2448454 RepID=A0A5N5I125_9ROSA|nr:hypothetical protein D8674_029060 [Pyrus ussuriensis x Pyrus communis]